MAVEPLILVANPGSASRKYALYKKGNALLKLHIEFVGGTLVAHTKTSKSEVSVPLATTDLAYSSMELGALIAASGALNKTEHIDAIAVRIVAPSSYFLQDHIVDDEVITKLEAIKNIAPLHIGATLEEIKRLKEHLPGVPIIGVSDSAFHAQKPDYAWNYAISLDDADQYEIKRFGYHGISLQSVTNTLKRSRYGLPDKTVICHLGSGASVTAVYNGVSVDTTMGYSPNEGLMMSTRSGTLEYSAAMSLAHQKGLEPDKLANELNNRAGLLGISGSSDDIRELLEKEAYGDYRAGLSLSMYVYKVRQAIAQMAAAMQGVDALVFTGTVGQRSFPMRQRIVDGLEYLNIVTKSSLNNACDEPKKLTPIHPRTRSKPVLVVPTDEESALAERARTLL